ncbi:MULTISPECIES: Npt1/Npt2 family nucleotide transporter [Mesonia]|uniref:Uncharacterized protein n=1 Tax=Mesonia oceanica TaxID=2687242 RepID=A0AC61Y470_9FLAO|nr:MULTISPECIES: Npt1/Npt2 family nucleotide transporter [Mesonia]MBJ96729.1 MFS transporter [Flavobacteriaceae bacterium]VVU99291.1 hypothetical protein FVB9532_00543 [Mesonia oceanica]
MLRKLVQRTFDIRSGELGVSLLMQLYIFLIITTLLIVKPTVNALFLSELTSQSLPYAFLLVALVAMGSSYFYNKALKRFSLLRIITFTLIISALVFISLKVLLSLHYFSTWLLYFYYVWVAIYAVLATSQFWILANLVYNIREAKRLFGFIGAGAISGGILGGYLTNLLAPIIGNDDLMIIGAILVIGCIPLLHIIWRKRVKSLGVFRQQQRTYASNESSFKLILESKHLTYIAGIIGVGVLVAKLVDYQYSDMASKAIPDSDELASFFGFWFSTFNASSLVIQLFLTRKIVGVWGTASTLLVLPLGIGLAAILFIVFPELWVVVLLKAVDGSLKQSINKAAQELLVLPVPTEIKNKTKSFIDVVVDSVATGIAGCLLIFVVRGLDFEAYQVSILILVFISIWFFFIYKVRKTYFHSFRDNLVSFRNKSQLDKKKQKSKSVSTKATIIKVLETGEDSEILFMLNKVNDVSDKRLRSLIIKLLDHPSSEIKAAAISNLYLLDKGTAAEKVEKLIHTKDDEVVLAAMRYLLTHTDINDLQVFDSYLNHENPYISSAALLCLAIESRDNKKLALRYNLELRLEKKIEDVNLPSEDHRIEETIELIQAIGYAENPKFYSFITAHFNNKNEEVISAAIKAAGISSSAIFLNDLLDFLQKKNFREESIKALKNYGHAIIKELIFKLNFDHISSNSKQFIPEIIGGFGGQQAVDGLFKLLRNKDLVVRLEAARVLNKLKTSNTTLKFSKKSVVRLILQECKLYHKTLSAMQIQKQIFIRYEDTLTNDKDLEEYSARNSLIEILEKRLDHGLEQIFTLLGLRYQQKDIEIAYHGILSDKQDIRANAIEFLDNLLHPNLKEALLPLVENTMVMSHETDRDDLVIPTEKHCFEMLLKGKDLKIKLAVLYLIAQLEDKSYISLVKPLIIHRNKKISTFAQDALNQLEKV